jgi:hypothetical protein
MFNSDKKWFGLISINSSGHPVHAHHTDQTGKVLCQTSFWGRAKAESFSHFSLPEKTHYSTSRCMISMGMPRATGKWRWMATDIYVRLGVQWETGNWRWMATDIYVLVCHEPQGNEYEWPQIYTSWYAMSLRKWRWMATDMNGFRQGCQMVCFQIKNPNLGKFWINVGIFYGHLVYFMVFCYFLWIFDIFHGNLVYFSLFLVFCTKKNLATLVFASFGHLVGLDDDKWNHLPRICCSVEISATSLRNTQCWQVPKLL